jgi:hypothetical protein
MEMTAAAVVRLFHPNYRASRLLPSSHLDRVASHLSRRDARRDRERVSSRKSGLARNSRQIFKTYTA